MGENTPKDCPYAHEFEEIKKLLSDVHEALLGTLEHPEHGLVNRVGVLEGWRISATSRVRNRKAFWYSVIGAVLSGIILVIVELIIK